MKQTTRTFFANNPNIPRRPLQFDRHAEKKIEEYPIELPENKPLPRVLGSIVLSSEYEGRGDKNNPYYNTFAFWGSIPISYSQWGKMRDKNNPILNNWYVTAIR